MNIIDLSQNTENIYSVRPREFDAKSNNKHYVGFIAEELNDIDTNFTWKNPDGTPEGIEWNNLMVYMIAEIKQLKKLNDDLLIQNSKLRDDIEHMLNNVNN
jgi:hypothetical protein